MNPHPVTYRRVPPSREQLLQALSRLKPGRSELAAFHLALPTHTPANFGLRREAGLWTWRGVSTAHRDPVEAACALAALGWVDTDRFLDINSCPSCWVKPVRTGAQVVVFGSDILFDVPLLRVPADVRPDDVSHIAHCVIAGEKAVGDLLETSTGQLRLVDAVGGLTLTPVMLPAI
jgi:hypothetical protein